MQIIVMNATKNQVNIAASGSKSEKERKSGRKAIEKKKKKKKDKTELTFNCPVL